MKQHFFIIILFSATLCAINLITKETPTFQPIETFVLQEKVKEEFNSFEEIFKHANDLFTQENYKEAAHFYKQALNFHPTCSHTFFNLGQAYFSQKKYTKAFKAYKKTIKYQPNHARAYAQMGKIFLNVKQYAEAAIYLEKSLELDPTNIETRLHLSRAYNDSQQFTKALELLKKGLALNQNSVNLLFELANIYNHLNQLEEALYLYKLLNEKIPNNPSILYNIGFTLKKLGKAQESLAYYDKSIELNPNHSDARFSRGLAYLVLGNFEKGWEGYEYRYHKPNQGCLRSVNKPRWDGSDLTDTTILLHSEQGLGDTLQFIRYAKLIKNTKNPKTIIAAVQKPLVTLLRLCPYIDIVITVDETAPEFDVHAPLMSLPFILKTTLETIPCEIPYIFADKKLSQQWKNTLDQDKNFKIGICVQGNENYATPQLRTTVALKSIQAKQLAPICAIPGVSVYSLQKTTGTDQFNNLPENVKIIVFKGDFDQNNGRFMDTAGVIPHLDLILTVDTSVGHLAAALGATTWIMLPNPADWRWMENRLDTPWYPNVRLFKQPKPGDWDSMIQEVAQELTKYIESKNNLNNANSM